MTTPEKSLILLEKAANLVEGLKEDQFDYNLFYYNKDKKETIDFHKCGSLGCVLGWMTTMPEFKGILEITPGWNVRHIPSELINYSGISKALEITEVEANFLFHPEFWVSLRKPGGFLPSNDPRVRSPSAEASPQEVAAHIRKFVNEKRKGTKYY